MAATKREFRTRESLEAEKHTRDMVPALLTQRGFTAVTDERRQHGPAQSQVISAVSPSGVPMKMHVRLCWRRDDRKPQEQKYSAAQLAAGLINNDWDRTLAQIAGREAANGNGHNLLVQPDNNVIRWAALVPSDQIPAIFQRQFEVSRDLINAGLTGRRKKNHARNGDSPTLWLQDDRTDDTHAVADVLWSWPGVIDVVALPPTGGPLTDDAYDDLPLDMLGRDEAMRVLRQTSGYPRDPKVRAAVLARAHGMCEREGCGVSRPFPGFLDVHHILGIRESDRVRNCVALCPNCHREAHFAPERDAINAALQTYASRFGELGHTPPARRK
ncbi:MAG TPA: HNH endonuclease signature motif containing protein [Caulobacteraceae bacterium]|nr:HNH endonuclease signature motif containing protein [Caulobacteraceae bacterium]